MSISRRSFLKSSGSVMGLSTVTCLGISPSIARALSTESSPSSTAQRLNRGWEFFEGSLAGPWEAWHLKTLEWQQVQLPHCFNHYDACDPDKPLYRGQGWYRTKLKCANPYPQGRTLLHFAGAGQRTAVYAASAQVGQNAGGYNQFVTDITEAERASNGELQLAVLCDNSRDLDSIPSDLSDFNLYGGLYRPVTLIYLPAIAVERMHIRSEVAPGHPAKCSLTARLYNPGSLTDRLTLEIEVIDSSGAKVYINSLVLAPWSGNVEVARFSVDDPHLWSPSSPSLYRCRLTVKSKHGEQTCTERFGLRKIEFVEHGPFLLNGEKLFLRGTQRHEDHAGYAAAVPEEVTRQELQMVCEMGTNFIRLAHYPQDELVLDLCDELGLIVWEELPWCRSGVGDEQMRNMAEGLLRSMIDQHFNHPSIVFWGLGNEEDWPDMYPGDGKETIRSVMQRLQKVAHEQDPSRFTSFRRCDPAKDIPDVYSPSIWAGWYSGEYRQYQQQLEHHRGTVAHLLHMEWGADTHAQRHAEEPYGEAGALFLPSAETATRSVPALPIVKNGDWSETYACDLFDWYLKVQETLPWFAGSAQWIFKDFATPDRPENPVPRVNQKGLVERDLTRKEGYFVFQSYWSKHPMVHIYGHSWPVRWGSAKEKRLVRVYSNCDSVELFLNDESCGVKRRDSQDFPCAGLRWTLTFREGNNSLRAVAHKDSSSVIDKTQFSYQTTPWSKPAELRLVSSKRTGKTATIEAKLFDQSGTLCLDARNRVRFGLTGGGKLNDNLGTSTGSRVVELYNGRAEISILLGLQPSIICVSSEGLPDAFFRVD